MFSKVLVPINVSVAEDAQKLLAAAKSLTAQWNCELHVVTVIPDVGMSIVGSYFSDDFEAKRTEAVAKELADAVSSAGVDAKTHVLSGTVYDKVIDLAAALHVDLIIIGAHQPAMRSYLLGSNAARLVRHSAQSVLVIRE